MGKTVRLKPQRLPEKLTRIRESLGLSQTELLNKMGLTEVFSYFVISKNELGTREPTAIELLRYARLANVIVDVLIDDDLDLPPVLPSPTKHEGIKRTKPKRASHNPK